MALSVAAFFMRSRWVRIPMTFGNPCDWRMLRNSKVSCIQINFKEIFQRMMLLLIHTISNPNEPSTMSNTRSAIFPMSIILLRSLLHSTKVRRFFLPLTTVIGPFASFKVCFA